jgi:hypothetical protein
MSAPGWSSFDASIVAALKAGEAGAVDKKAGGGMRSPINGDNHWIPWKAGNYKKGTVEFGEPLMSLRVSPTYVLSDPLENFIVGQDLVAMALNGEWKKAETHRLGYENSEDAVSWNVFRALQEAGKLANVASMLTGETVSAEPDLILWGHRVTETAAHDVPRLQLALDVLEPAHSQQTEPDVILRVPGWGWIFIEAKFSSPSPKVAENKFEAWVNRYIDRWRASGP